MWLAFLTPPEHGLDCAPASRVNPAARLLLKPLDLERCHKLITCIFRTIRLTSPPPSLEGNGGASYSPNVAYLACWGLG